jgi:DNA-binding beta-propeller fold protein YncE
MAQCVRLICTVLAALALASAGCTPLAVDPQAAEADGASIAEAELVWPAAPELPRIRYLQSISSAQDVGIRPGLLTRIARFLKGEEERGLVRPHGLSTDAEGRLYVVDAAVRRVHVFDVEHGTHYAFPERPADDFASPIDVAAGTQGRIYVSDSVTNVVHVFSGHGKRYERSIGAGRLLRPTGLAVDTLNGRLLVTDTVASTLVVFDERSLELVAVIGGQGGETEQFHAPTNVTVAGDGTIVVTDALNFRVQQLDSDLRFVQSFGAVGKAPGHFSRPKGVAVDSAGHIYVVDALFANVQIFDREGRLLLAFGRPGQAPGEFWLPSDILIDDRDRIFVSDAWNERVQVFQYLDHEKELQ